MDTSLIDTSTFVVPTVMGVIATLVVPLILRLHWPRWARLTVSLVIAAVLGAAVWIFAFRPDTWQQVAIWLTTAVGISQVVYQLLKPLGIFGWLSELTNDMPPVQVEQTIYGAPTHAALDDDLEADDV